MLNRRRVFSTFFAASLGAVLVTQNAGAQTYPTRPISLVVPFGAGSTTDTLGRIVGEHLGQALGQRFIIINSAGAGGNIGTQQVAHANPDGYTLILAAPGPFVINKTMMKLSYDPETSFEMITPLATLANILVVNPNKVPVTNVKDFIQFALKHRGSLNYASMGPGTTQHIAAAYLDILAGTQMVHVPYRTGGQLLLDLTAGEVPVAFQNYANVTGALKSGKLRAIGVASKQRSIFLPNVPTVAEQGVAGLEVSAWFGLAAPKGTPPAIVNLINAKTLEVMALPAVKDLLFKIGIEIWTSSPAEFAKFIKTENAKWPPILKDIMKPN